VASGVYMIDETPIFGGAYLRAEVWRYRRANRVLSSTSTPKNKYEKKKRERYEMKRETCDREAILGLT